MFIIDRFAALPTVKEISAVLKNAGAYFESRAIAFFASRSAPGRSSDSRLAMANVVIRSGISKVGVSEWRCSLQSLLLDHLSNGAPRRDCSTPKGTQGLLR